LQKRKERYTGSVHNRKTATQAIQKSKKSKTEEQEIIPAALDQSSKVRITVSLTAIRFLSFPSKLLEFLSHQIHQNTQGGTMSHMPFHSTGIMKKLNNAASKSRTSLYPNENYINKQQLI
jgi:hypothetical protein